MNLRTRVVSGLLAAMVVFAGVAVVVVAVQRDQLTDQLDARLESISPLRRPIREPPPAGSTPVGGAPSEGIPPLGANDDPQISEVYVANITEGTFKELNVGQLLTDTPDVEAVVVAAETRTNRFVTVDSTSGDAGFRVLIERLDDGVVGVIAIPTDDLVATTDQLVTTFAAAAALMFTVLTAVGWWVIRLGLRPIRDVTAAADAIAAGDKSRRAPETAGSTEAGHLAAAFNTMLDERDAADNRLRQFAADASHELRTPLTSIRGYLELYEDGGFREPGELDDIVRRMRGESARMGELVDDLLQLARMDESGGINAEVVDVGDLVRDVAAGASAGAPERTIHVSAPLTGRLIAEVDHAKIHQVVAGLCANALTHAPDATVQLEASGTASEIVISVADDGDGLSPEDAAKVFHRFYRTDDARGRASGGSGLGLSIARSLIEAHNGTIDLDSAPGMGSTFTVRLPRHV
ncbi:MAG: HAMP domain-containing histidine kinase [Actinomycetia bacterium]|nr:HAMP domain-containing histidine kinase [Actinomycetes bacterium]